MLYTVGEMAKLLGIAASTLRYYDQEGLLPFVERSSGGVRVFTEQDYAPLAVICCLKKSGLSVREIRAFVMLAQQGDQAALQKAAQEASKGSPERLREMVKSIVGSPDGAALLRRLDETMGKQ